MKREIELPWHCQRSGDCCRQVPQIVMTVEEMNVLKNVHPELQFYQHVDRRFVYLKGLPCPLLRMEGKKATCTVHSIRPYNCRRFGCFRPDISTEPYQGESLDLERGRLGCANLSDRLSNREVRRAYAQMQRKAQRWARQHGWGEGLLPTPSGHAVTFYKMSQL